MTTPTASTVTTTGRRLDPQTLREAFGQFPTGVVALAAEVDGERVGLAASTFVPVSLDPPLVSVCIQNTSSTWPRLAGADRLGISVLGAEHGAAARTLGRKAGDRFAGLSTHATRQGALFVEGACTWLDTSVADTVHAGDHTIALLRVHDLTVRPEFSPLVFHASAFRQLLTAS
ncbi:flavin reductase family protein [Streptomyces sp. NBC_00006]|uniref:flavin reductase family protein n=1 Tax=unclassified Streptomyces TaxID=2593676 RepID=UPI00225291A2|nr:MULTISPECIES: flavin reductase family protein [unclassified Streptomyces]MCX5535835.1 flavin reductase family protein [Streptomyces sp. NBC_00006]